MHVVDHRDRRPVLLVTVLAATLAIIVTLVLANDLSGRPLSTGGRTRVAPRLSGPRTTRVADMSFGGSLTAPLGGPVPWLWPPADRSAPLAR